MCDAHTVIHYASIIVFVPANNIQYVREPWFIPIPKFFTAATMLFRPTLLKIRPFSDLFLLQNQTNFRPILSSNFEKSDFNVRAKENWVRQAKIEYLLLADTLNYLFSFLLAHKVALHCHYKFCHCNKSNSNRWFSVAIFKIFPKNLTFWKKEDFFLTSFWLKVWILTFPEKSDQRSSGASVKNVIKVQQTLI